MDTKDFSAEILGVLEADRSLPRTRGGIAKVIKDEWDHYLTQEQLKLALGKLVADGTVKEVMGGNIPWYFPNKQRGTTYFVLPEVYVQHRDEVDERAREAADIELRARHQDEWDELYKHAKTHQEWRHS